MSGLIKVVICLFSTFVFGNALSADKYCSSKGAEAQPVDIHLFVHTYGDMSQRNEMFRELDELRKNFKPGQKIRVYKHERGAYYAAIEQCYPGCPERTLLEGLFDASCSDVVAKRDRLSLDRRLLTIIAEGVKQTSTSYEILSEVQALVNFYEANARKSQVFAALSLMPFGVKPGDRAALDTLFTKWTSALTLTAPTLPPINILGCPRDKEIIVFWKEIFAWKKVEFSPICARDRN